MKHHCCEDSRKDTDIIPIENAHAEVSNAGKNVGVSAPRLKHLVELKLAAASVLASKNQFVILAGWKCDDDFAAITLFSATDRPYAAENTNIAAKFLHQVE